MITEQSHTFTIGIIGKDGRTSAIERCLRSDVRVARVVMLASGKEATRELLLSKVSDAVEKVRPDFVVVGPEEPLANGVVDYLKQRYQIPCVGPTKNLSRLESSKAFTRGLLAKYGIPGNPRFKIFETTEKVEAYLHELGEFVIKPDGLTGGKGVKVWGDHLHSVSEALDYCTELLATNGSRIVIEERLDGEEFSLQSFSDGQHVVHMPLVQDHKRAYDGDTGPNTGGMGSYSCSDHSLPFVQKKLLLEAQRINERVARALHAECGEPYMGILFGGFMVTRDGVRLLEYNARFGDPESLNVLSLLETSFLDVCLAIIDGNLDDLDVRFRQQATVCKYVVPFGYPAKPVPRYR